MSIQIKGIDMPKEGRSICLTIWNDGDVFARDVEKDKIIMVGAEAIQIDRPHGRLIDIDELSHNMYHQAFETDSDMQKWESGCWIRYKMFEIERDNAPTILEAEE